MKYWRIFRVTTCLAVVLCLLLALEIQAMAPRPRIWDQAVLIVPEPMPVLQLAFDVQYLRGVTLVSYRGREKPELYHWDNGDWRAVGIDGFAQALRDLPASASITLVGDGEILPGKLKDLIMQSAPQTELLDKLQPAELLNGLNEIFLFQPNEWQWLAARHGVELKDINAPLRVYDPYALRRSEMPLTPEEIPVDPDGPPPARVEIQ